MSIDIVVATNLDGAIGYKNELLYKNNADMKRFKNVTEGHFALLARKTWESLKKPLSNRINVILTRNNHYCINPKLKSDYHILIEHDLHKIINHYQSGENERNLVVCGGSDLYKQMLPFTDRVFLTLFHDNNKEADAYFPLEELSNFTITHTEKHFDEKSGLYYSFINYKRKEGLND